MTSVSSTDTSTETSTDTSAILRRPDRLYDGYVFDLDGTVYLGNALLPGAADVIARVRGLGRRTVFLSNNPTRDPQMYADKLGGLGIATPSTNRQPGGHRAPVAEGHPPGRPGLRHQRGALKRAWRRPESGSPRTPRRSTSSSRATTAPSSTASCRTPSTRCGSTSVPGSSPPTPTASAPCPAAAASPTPPSIVAAIEACTGVTCEANLGKPGAEMLRPCSGCSACPPTAADDRRPALHRHRHGRTAGMDSALVLTGETTPAMAALFRRTAPRPGSSTGSTTWHPSRSVTGRARRQRATADGRRCRPGISGTRQPGPRRVAWPPAAIPRTRGGGGGDDATCDHRVVDGDGGIGACGSCCRARARVFPHGSGRAV